MADVINKAEFRKLQKHLRSLPARIQKNVVTGANRAGTVEVLKEVRKNVPVDEGEVKKAIYVKKRKTKKTEVRHSVTIRKKKLKNGINGSKNTAQVAYYLEYGTENMRERRFIRPALSSVGQRPVTVARAYFKKRLPKELAKKR